MKKDVWPQLSSLPSCSFIFFFSGSDDLGFLAVSLAKKTAQDLPVNSWECSPDARAVTLTETLLVPPSTVAVTVASCRMAMALEPRPGATTSFFFF